MGLTEDRTQEIFLTEGILQEGESMWLTDDGYIVIGPLEEQPDWMPYTLDK